MKIEMADGTIGIPRPEALARLERFGVSAARLDTRMAVEAITVEAVGRTNVWPEPWIAQIESETWADLTAQAVVLKSGPATPAMLDPTDLTRPRWRRRPDMVDGHPRPDRYDRTWVGIDLAVGPASIDQQDAVRMAWPLTLRQRQILGHQGQPAWTPAERWLLVVTAGGWVPPGYVWAIGEISVLGAGRFGFDLDPVAADELDKFSGRWVPTRDRELVDLVPADVATTGAPPPPPAAAPAPTPQPSLVTAPVPLAAPAAPKALTDRHFAVLDRLGDAPDTLDVVEQRGWLANFGSLSTAELDELEALLDASADTAPRATEAKVTHWRRWNHAPRSTVWVDVLTGAAVDDAGRRFGVGPARARKAGIRLGELLTGLPESTARAYLCGPRPGGDTAAGMRTWALDALPDGWQPHPSGHHLDAELPVARYRRENNTQLEVHRVGTWLDDSDVTPELARTTMAAVDRALRAVFIPPHRPGKQPPAGMLEGKAAWLSTPATTGRELWRSSIAHDTTWPVLDPDMAALIRSTSGQGRVELFDRGPQLPGLSYYDGRWMYAALVNELPVGPAEHRTGPAATYEPYAKGRYRVTATVPSDWEHVGILPLADPDSTTGGWTWPATPGARFETWADGTELLVAHHHGWDFKVLESITFPGKGRPLDAWASRLTKARSLLDGWASAGEIPTAAAGLARGALRSILLHAIGAFHGQPRQVTRSSTDPDAAPTGVDRHQIGALWVWSEPRPPVQAELVHPEWSSTVWARCRARILDGPGPNKTRTGALHVPAGDVIGIRTDALYLTSDPGWVDDGNIGRLRLKATLDGPIDAPHGQAELLSLRQLAETAGR